MYKTQRATSQANNTKNSAINNLREDILWYILLTCFISITVIIQYLGKEKILNISGFYIPDSNTYELRVFSSQELEGFSASIYNHINRFLYNLAPQSFMWLNTSLLFISLQLCRNIFKHISPASINYARLAIVANPYLLIGVIGPNKETILTFTCLLFWNFFINSKGTKRITLVIIVAALPLIIRPVVSFPLLIAIVLSPYVKYLKKPTVIIIALLALYFLVNTLPFTNELISSIQDNDLTSFRESRIYDVAIQLKILSRHPIFQYPAFFAKSMLLLFGFIFRPLQIFAQPFPLLDIAYSYLAYLFFPFNLSIVMLFMSKWNKRYIIDNNVTSNLLVFTGLSLLTVIFNSVLTFRYIFPYMPFVFALFPINCYSAKKIIISVSAICCLFTLISSTVSDFGNTGSPITIVEPENIPRFMQWL